MKYIDKFLKYLKTDRNTFLTYILTLVTVYLAVDRIVEMLLLIFSGMSVSYWGPITYTLALACPVFAFLFSGSSKFNDSDASKLAFFNIYIISLYIIIVSMVTQWINLGGWILLLSVPNYPYIVSEFSNLISPAFSALAVYLPLTTFYPVIKWLFMKINDTKDLRDSIFDYGGIDLSDKTIGMGPYTCEMYMCRDKETGKTIKMPEVKRFESLLVVGVSGSGKTSLVFEPMIARDIDKKYFFKEIAKEMGFTALKTGIASLNCPYSNSYINENFVLSMLTPNPAKEKLYQAYMNKMIYNKSGNKYIYRNLGITYVSPDYESISHMLEVADAYKMPVNVIDPNDANSIGLNPFVYDDPIKTSVAISTVLKGLYASTNPDVQIAYRENMASQAIENLAILLKEMYPRLHNEDLPTLEDMLRMLNNFDLIEAMCEELKKDEELVEQYSIQLGYFEKNFYQSGSGRKEMEQYVTAATTQLDNLLRYPGLKNILCNRTNNLNYDDVLENGGITYVCTRRGDLGANAHKAFGLFFILLMQYSILRRPGNENSRIPHFLYVDEFSDFITAATEPIFTLYRKYRVAPVISAQNLDQLGAEHNRFKQTILSNCANKIVFGNNTPEDNEWWSKELGDKREWTFSNTYNTDKTEYDPKYGNIKWAWVPNYKAGKVQALKFRNCMYKIKDLKGKNNIGTAKLDFLESKYKEPKEVKEYNFEKFTTGIAEDPSIKKKKKRTSLKNTHFSDDDTHDIDPIQTDRTDSRFLLENDEAIIFDLKKGNSN